MRNSRSVGGVDGRPSVLSCRAACLIPSVSSLSSPLTIHAHTLFRLLPLPSPTPSLPLTPPIDPFPTPSPVSDHPCPVLEYSLYQVSPGHSPSRSPCTTPNNTKPTQQQARPISQKTNLSPRPVHPSRSYTRLSVLTVYFFPSWQVLSCLGMPLNEPIPFFYTSFFPALGSPREPHTTI